MRARHQPHSLPAFPVYASAFVSDNELVLGGGGGASRSGIKNKLRMYNVGKDRSLELLDEFELEKGEDAPMSMATHPKTDTIICGVNSTVEKLEKGENENCRVFTVKDYKLGLLRTYGTLSGDLDDYQKVTVLSPDSSVLAVAGSHDLALLSYPSLVPISKPIHTEKEIYDVTISGTTLVIATTLNLLVYALPSPAETPQNASPPKGKRNNKRKESKPSAQQIPPTLEILRTVELPSMIGGETSTFRAARYHPIDNTLYTVINTLSPRTKATKTPQRQAFVCKWNTESWSLEKTRKVSDRGITCFEISENGKFLGFGSSDLTIGLLDATTLNSVITILKAHEFPPTTVTFNPSSSLFISGSADNSVRVVSVPPQSEGSSSWGIIFSIIKTIALILLAFIVQRYLTNNLGKTS